MMRTHHMNHRPIYLSSPYSLSMSSGRSPNQCWLFFIQPHCLIDTVLIAYCNYSHTYFLAEMPCPFTHVVCLTVRQALVVVIFTPGKARYIICHMLGYIGAVRFWKRGAVNGQQQQQNDVLTRN